MKKPAKNEGERPDVAAGRCKSSFYEEAEKERPIIGKVGRVTSALKRVLYWGGDCEYSTCWDRSRKSWKLTPSENAAEATTNRKIGFKKNRSTRIVLGKSSNTKFATRAGKPNSKRALVQIRSLKEARHKQWQKFEAVISLKRSKNLCQNYWTN